MDNLTFGEAIVLMKAGHTVARAGWNGKGMFIFIRKGRKIKNVEEGSEMVRGTGKDFFYSRDHICMRDCEGKCIVGWLASQIDMLAEDWEVVD